ncbi:MAG TPA: PTS system mannose/fructose/sorbose family transporter subunit IID [Coriobacteriaceae bacterium]|nr:PTS system mannose/fructose/sorbose family transporter subunit IID [Coriobacteriaceae bacterium]
MENENITAAEGKPSGYKVTKKDLRNANWRWLMSVCTFNYQTQQGASVAYALSPVLRKIYTNDEDYKQALNNHFRYYNTQPWLAAIILGACVAMEERDGLAAADAVQDLKIGTMGPLAGVGDSLLMTMIPTIMGSIAAYMAIEGNPVGAGIWFALILAIFWVRMHALEFGYKQGVKLVTDFSEKLPNLTAAASVLGLTVVGCLIASVIGVTCPIRFSFGDVSMEIQPLLDKILPAMIPAAITGSAYYLLTKKNASMTALILVVIVLAMVASAAGILA